MRPLAPCLMVQGTSSGAGKSWVTTALCRLFARAGHRVAPFKSQNMALNAAVVRAAGRTGAGAPGARGEDPMITVDGGEIGRAQAAQAEAAGLEPTVDMNPILLKPESDRRSQVVVLGKPFASVDYSEYARMAPRLLEIVAASLERLRRAHDVVVIEGAGSPAEINLSATEIVNMRIARLAEAPVLLVGDIDRGGVFAAFVGTLALLPQDDRARVRGFLVNRFRGDAALLSPALEELTARTGVPVLGVIPWVDERLVPAEDSLDLHALERHVPDAAVQVAIARLPRISNFDDFEPLTREPGVSLRLVSRPAELLDADLIVLPGSKNTAEDLAWLRQTGLADAIVAAARSGCAVLGVCGGYQMLGTVVHDPERVESSRVETRGLGLLAVSTWLGREKTTVGIRAVVGACAGPFAAAAGSEIRAYEIHVGRTQVASTRQPFRIVARGDARLDEGDGAMTADGAVVGTYLHGLLANDALRGALLRFLATRRGRAVDPRWGAPSAAAARYDALADVVAASCDLGAIGKLTGVALRGEPKASRAGES